MQPLAKVPDIPLVLVAGADAGFPTLQALLDKAKAAEVLMGNTGVSTSQHLAAELPATLAKVHLSSVLYRGSGPRSWMSSAGTSRSRSST
ncbi:MAG: tripartite tricarboxylate transporter substrate-binding protein [Burkholderiaceae bacterium]|nr:tripartite tricarboxylate transporter substrate-binding protein [Burkholderiaceae bacterium]